MNGRGCARARRRRLLGREGAFGALGRLWAERHLARCAECRTFAAQARAVEALLAPRGDAALPARVMHALRDAAARASPILTREAESRRWARRFVGATCAAAAAGLAAAWLNLDLLPPHAGDDAAVERRLAALEHRLEEDGPAPSRWREEGLDERLDALEAELDCLDAETETMTWSFQEGGDPCIES